MLGHYYFGNRHDRGILQAIAPILEIEQEEIVEMTFSLLLVILVDYVIKLKQTKLLYEKFY
jgi:hypothetical protein